MRRREERVSTNNTNFFSLFRVVGLRNFVWKNYGFYFALCVTIIFGWVINHTDKLKINDIAEYFGDPIASISATLLGIIIAGFAIILAVANGKILNLLLEDSTLQKLLYPFWFISFFWALSTFLSIVIVFLSNLVSENIMKYVFCAEVFIFTYSLCGTVILIGNTVVLTLHLAELEPPEEN
ncbi:hypothetical protein [Brevibacillus sp. MER 51]|uniref:hypothetical protein n=1 Tax=Brevibacillus sp. MER 51 TaxID=2939560 RepID=UPI00203D387C|nr:hypothetical protein [Brevibacillus sp. MER 51]MCM3144690.1 hypothetical protein [Brevibacillus sp. MER 51]